jgi:hypothetical protein
MRRERLDKDYRGTHGHTWGLNIGSPLCTNGEQVSMIAASSTMLPINMQFVTPCAETQ